MKRAYIARFCDASDKFSTIFNLNFFHFLVRKFDFAHPTTPNMGIKRSDLANNFLILRLPTIESIDIDQIVTSEEERRQIMDCLSSLYGAAGRFRRSSCELRP